MIGSFRVTTWGLPKPGEGWQITKTTEKTQHQRRPIFYGDFFQLVAKSLFDPGVTDPGGNDLGSDTLGSVKNVRSGLAQGKTPHPEGGGG